MKPGIKIAFSILRWALLFLKYTKNFNSWLRFGNLFSRLVTAGKFCGHVLVIGLKNFTSCSIYI